MHGLPPLEEKVAGLKRTTNRRFESIESRLASLEGQVASEAGTGEFGRNGKEQASVQSLLQRLDRLEKHKEENAAMKPRLLCFQKAQLDVDIPVHIAREIDSRFSFSLSKLFPAEVPSPLRDSISLLVLNIHATNMYLHGRRIVVDPRMLPGYHRITERKLKLIYESFIKEDAAIAWLRRVTRSEKFGIGRMLSRYFESLELSQRFEIEVAIEMRLLILLG
ncbi:hypothetical protein VNI00_010489 [Paramarasmius palmivorus]|uniref:Uncharacterized protein n=1 Tax=Paramarasmius palmivorus TaxID=297713 RepID=A0AAW0CJE5_9AGAR